MGTVGAGFSMSLDGFIAGANDSMDLVFGWMFGGDTDFTMSTGDHDIELKLEPESIEQFEAAAHGVGAIVSGRRMFDVAGAWGGKHPLDVPIVVLTHTIPPEWSGEDSPFHFVTDGIESAIALAQEIAGDKSVGVGGGDVTRQCLKAGLLDELQIDLVPVLLGDGVRLFEQLGIEPIQLEITEVTPASKVTHIRYRVLK